MKYSLSFVSSCALLCACEPEFDPYNELTRVRVLAVRAEPPELTEGSTARVDALIYRDPRTDVEQTWSLCPWTSDPDDGFACPVDQRTLDETWTDAGLTGTAPRLSLGRSESSALRFPGTLAEARKLCVALTAKLKSSETLPPDCDVRWDWTVRLSVEANDAHIEAVKTVALLLDGKRAPNRNPALTALRIETESGESEPLSEDSELALPASGDYVLRTTLAEDAVESYTPPPVPGQSNVSTMRETLSLTWFVDAGSTDRIRTSYGEGLDSLSEATRNEWYSPEGPARVRLFVVVRDERGGVAFREGTVQLAK